MQNEEEMESTRKRNYRTIKELIRISFGLGINLTTPSVFKDSLRIITVLLFAINTVAMYANWCFFMRHKDKIIEVGETVGIALQGISTLIKMTYYLFTQRRFYQLLRTAQTHEILYNLEIFKTDFPGQKPLKLEVDAIMNDTWKIVRKQLMFYFCCCVGIMCNYFFTALFFNLYHQIKATPNYEDILPTPALYPMWEGKGMAFPYFHIEMFVFGCAVFLAAGGAFSFDATFIVLCLHAVGMVKALNLIILRSTSPLVPKERRVEYLRYCIYHYERIYSYVQDVNRIYLHISLALFLLGLGVLGFVLFEMNISFESNVVDMMIRMLMFLVAASFQNVIYCYNSQQLITASEETQFALYSCDWYDESREFKQLIQMMIMRTSRSFTLNISWFALMNFPTLLAVNRLSASYFLLLRNLSG